MTTYIAVAAGAVFLTVVVGMIIPEGKLHTSVNFVLRIACIFILISPIAQIFDISLSEGGEGDVDFDYICQVYSEGQSSQLEKLIEENIGIECDCDVEIVYEDGSIKENGVTIYTDNVESALIDDIVSYLKELGYININVNEKTG